jgi:hypothetical protein
MDMWSQAAENLVVGTALQESNLMWLHQIGDGPALGFFQIEPATHSDLWSNYIQHRPKLMQIMHELITPGVDRERQLITNIAYATAVCRLIYYRRPEPLPEPEDIDGLASYWKQHYNTVLGKGTAAEWSVKYREFAQ